MESTRGRVTSLSLMPRSVDSEYEIKMRAGNGPYAGQVNVTIQ